MKEKCKILKINSPVAKKEHVCEVCGKKIAVGERYELTTYVSGGKIHDSRRHLKCHKEMKVSNDKDFRKEMSIDTRQMLDVFSFEECMQIAFFPLVITELAWNFTFRVCELAGVEKIQETKKLSRAVKELRNSYVEYCRQDLDKKHFDHIVTETKKFTEECSKDFTILYFTCNNEIKKNFPDIRYIDLRTYAYMALAMIDTLKEHNKRMDKKIAERLGKDSRVISSVLPKHIKALEDCLEAYMSPVSYVKIDHIKNSIAIILNKISTSEFVVH